MTLESKDPTAESSAPAAEPRQSKPAKTTEPKVIVPERFRRAQFRSFTEVCGKQFTTMMGQWLYHRRDQFERDGEAVGRYCFELPHIDPTCEHLHVLRKAIAERLTATAARACGLELFDLNYIEFHATLYHHGSFFSWHLDNLDPGGEPEVSRQLSFAYFMHAEPKMFKGGTYEFLDGTIVQPEADTLLLYNPAQRLRINRVECYSAEVLHGSWALMGWLHGKKIALAKDVKSG